MRRIRSTGTLPEIRVREAIGRLGFRGYRNNNRVILGNPDIVWSRKKVAVFVNGCFWHAHGCAEGIRKPKSNREYWIPKLTENRMRDRRNRHILRSRGWRILTIWECQISSMDSTASKLRVFLCNSGLRRASVAR